MQRRVDFLARAENCLESYREFTDDEAPRPAIADLIMYENVLISCQEPGSPFHGCDPLKVMEMLIAHNDGLVIQVPLMAALDAQCEEILNDYAEEAEQCR